MATKAGVGRSSRRDAIAAGREATALACAPLEGSAPDLLLVFGTSGYDQHALLGAIRAAAPAARIVGCSGEGIIAGGASDESEHAVAVMALRSEVFEFEPLLVTGYAGDPAGAGRDLASRVNASRRGDELGLLVFPDGLHGNCTALLRAIESGLERPLAVVGGAAGDAMAMVETWQYVDGEAVTGSIAALLVRGRGRIELAVSHGCQPIGLERRVTRAENGWLHEIDGRPAWSVFREYLEGVPETFNAEVSSHIAIGQALPPDPARDYQAFIVHTPLGLDPANGALFFPGGGLATGDTIRMTRRDPDRIGESARRSATGIADRHPGREPAFVMQFDCAGRGRMLFGQDAADHIVRPLRESLGLGVPWIGFHTFGEIAPIDGRSYYHNYTVALCAVYDSPEP